ncbi:CbiQ family ECF transporter T component [Aeromicrobium alkaliterrae]|uniref:CbiQ family ECF transporter T component n=1 Tax=Aeromicrobium alkaliterrae TaxID=302168 RepID=A0ABN2JXZ0_9ACTN
MPEKGRASLPRDLAPGAWWVWALALAAAASTTLNPFALLLICAVAALVVAARRTDAPWALSFRFYVYFALVVVVVRVVFHVLLAGGGYSDDVVLLRLPEIPLPEAARGIRLLGDVTRASILSGLYDGMRLGTIIICVGAANTLANPKRLLKSVPPALYEVGTTIVVALSLFPQLAESVQRVRRARRLRGDGMRRTAVLRRIVVPVLEDALERSMTLAAGMDARGYGRSGRATPRQRFVTGALVLVALFLLTVGIYGYLDATAPRVIGIPALVLGAGVALLAMTAAGRRVQRTRYRPQRWLAPEWFTAASGVAVAALMEVADGAVPAAVIPPLDALPTLPVWCVLAVLVGALPALLTPAPAAAPSPDGSPTTPREVARADAA